MHSIIHLLSIIITRRIKDSEYLYTILANNYFIKLLTLYNISSSESILKDIRYFSQKKIDNIPSLKNDNYIINPKKPQIESSETIIET